MFRGNHPAKAEESGRLKLPTAFKELIEGAGITQFYVTSVDGKSAEIWPIGEWEKREAQLLAFSTMNPTVKKYLNKTGYYGQQLKMDGQGRLVLPQILREAAALEGDVIVIGRISYLEVFNRAKYEETVMSDDLTEVDLNTIAQMLEQPKQAGDR